MSECCASPVIKREHFAFRILGGHYTCFNGLFPSDSCSNCGIAHQTFDGPKLWLYELINLFAPWDGAMCSENHE